MKLYWSFFRIRFLHSLQYRAAAIAGMLTQFAWGGMRVAMFYAFYRSDPAAFPMGMEALSSYLWIQQAFLMLFVVYRLDNNIFDAITGGNIAYELARPVDLYAMWFATNAGERFARAALRCLPVLVVASFLPAPFGLSAPPDLPTFLAFLVSLFAAALVVTAFTMLIYISTFYTMAPGGGGVKMVCTILVEFLTGALIPLPFFPKALQFWLELTPFAAMENLPLRIYSGNVAGSALTNGLLLQAFWLFALIVTGKLWLDHAQKRVVVQGG